MCSFLSRGGESSRLCLKERYVQGKGKRQGQNKSPSYQWVDELIMAFWAGFISVLGYCSLLFTMVWFHDGCSNNKVINFVTTQDSLFLLEKGSYNNRQWIGFSPLLARKWSYFGTADFLLQGTNVGYWRNLSTNEGFPAPPVQKGQQELLSPPDTSFQMAPWLGCLSPSTQCLELHHKPVLALSMWNVAPSSENHLCPQGVPKRRRCKWQGNAEHQDPWALQPVVWEQCVIHSRAIATDPVSAMAKLGFVLTGNGIEVRWSKML